MVHRGRPKLTRLEHEQLYLGMRGMLATHAPYLSQSSVRHYERSSRTARERSRGAAVTYPRRPPPPPRRRRRPLPTVRQLVERERPFDPEVPPERIRAAAPLRGECPRHHSS